MSAHCRIEHRNSATDDQDEENFIDKLILVVNETTEQTERLMESLLEKAQGLVEELIDFKSSFPKCDTIYGGLESSKFQQIYNFYNYKVFICVFLEI